MKLAGRARILYNEAPDLRLGGDLRRTILADHNVCRLTSGPPLERSSLCRCIRARMHNFRWFRAELFVVCEKSFKGCAWFFSISDVDASEKKSVLIISSCFYVCVPKLLPESGLGSLLLLDMRSSRLDFGWHTVTVVAPHCASLPSWN